MKKIILTALVIISVSPSAFAFTYKICLHNGEEFATTTTNGLCPAYKDGCKHNHDPYLFNKTAIVLPEDFPPMCPSDDAITHCTLSSKLRSENIGPGGH